MTEKETKRINRQIRRTERDIAQYKGHVENAEERLRSLVGLVRDDVHLDYQVLQWSANSWRKISYYAKRLQETTEKLDDLYRQRDGRPTRREQGIADSNRMEENMMREAHRERTEWAQDEAGARYDSVNEQDRDCGPTYDPDQDG
jgi:hypothetical protein